jgi:beta-aspartyl-dipeptidase (metallo-type)
MRVKMLGRRTMRLQRYFDSGAPAERVSVSSDAGGCLPCFDAQGRMSHMDIGSPGALLATIGELLARGLPLQQILPAFTRNVAELLRLPRKGVLAAGADADLLVLDEQSRICDVMLGGRWQVREGQAVARGPLDASPPSFDSGNGNN